MSLIIRSDTLERKGKSASSSNVNNEFTLADVIKKLKSMDVSQNEKYRSINDKSISYENKWVISDLRNKVATLDNKKYSIYNLSSEEVIIKVQSRLVKIKNVNLY